MPYTIRTPDERARLEVRDKPYFASLSESLHLGYRKGKFKRSWVIRRKTGDRYQTETVVGVRPDDPDTSGTLTKMSFTEMEKRIMSDAEYHCSFCGKSSKVIEKLVVGPGVHICNRCNDIAYYVMRAPDGAGMVKIDEEGRAMLDETGKPVYEA